MFFRIDKFGLVAVMLTLLVSGCKKKPEPGPLRPDHVSRFHWIGKKQLAASTNAAGLMKIWDTAESKALETQTLDKLATAPWRLGSTNGTALSPILTNSALALNEFPEAPLLRPLLDDLVEEESFAEIRFGTNYPLTAVFAIHLASDRAALWRTNLSAILRDSIGARMEAGSATNSLKTRVSPNGSPFSFQLEIGSMQDWFLITASAQTNSALVELMQQMESKVFPRISTAGNLLEADVDTPGTLAFLCGLKVPKDLKLSHATLVVTGDGTNILSRLDLVARQAFGFSMKPWHIPTNLAQGPLVGFSAVRGVSSVLGGMKFLSALQPAPDQVFVWNSAGLPFQTYFALKADDATNAWKALAQPLADFINPRLEPNYGTLTVETQSLRLDWKGLGHAYPFLEVETNAPEFIFGGFGPYVNRNHPLSSALVNHIVAESNLIALDWEGTGQRLIDWRYLDDVYRIVFDAHGPRLNDTASMRWIVQHSTNLIQALTETTLVDSNRITVARRSTIGLTGAEIELVANWLELPDFPFGLRTVMATNPAPVKRIAPRMRANATHSNTPPQPSRLRHRRSRLRVDS